MQCSSQVEAILQLLGLQHRANTVVGDALLRGVSGGEKKRVSIGIEGAKSPGVMLFDEPTTGLDSSAALDVSIVLRKKKMEIGLTKFPFRSCAVCAQQWTQDAPRLYLSYNLATMFTICLTTLWFLRTAKLHSLERKKMLWSTLPA